MERPVSIVWFERCYLGALAVGLLNTALSWDQTLRQMSETPGMDQYGSTIVLVGSAVGILISLLLWFFAARKRSSVAKWIIVVLFAIGLLGLLFALPMGTYPQGVAGVLGIVAFVLNAIAVWQLFKPDATAWFGGPSAA